MYAKKMIEYTSTRSIKTQNLKYDDVLLQGLAPDKGLYVPVSYPRISPSDLTKLVGKPYIEIFHFIKSLFIGDSISRQLQLDIAKRAFSNEKFPEHNYEIAPLIEIGGGMHVQQLSLGPTAAFKDMALQPLGQDMQYVLSQRGQKLVLLGATSGDTGSAAESAVRGLENIKLFILSPETGMSDFQKAQMGVLSGNGIFNISIDGRFDDCQAIVKQIKQDPSYKHLGAVNSINWGRIASQVPYYVSGYLQAVGNDVGQEVDFVVPTGNFGNVLAGYIAKSIGLPIRRLIVATNENSVVDTLIQTGVYQKPPKAVVTTSPSMDITVASNYERLAYDLLGKNSAKLDKYMSEFESTGRVDISDYGLQSSVFRDFGFDSGSSNAQDRLYTIKDVYSKNGEIFDPHTSDGIHVALQKRQSGVPIICMSTALPVKFENTIKQALGFAPERPKRFIGLGGYSKDSFVSLPNDARVVKDFLSKNIS